MEPVSHRFTDLGTCIDELHELFDAWAAANPFAPALGAYGLEVMRLAVHEWMANLVQHADFAGRGAVIELALAPAAQRLRCRIADTSRGFDFEHQLAVQRALVKTGFAHGQPPERGRGLMMLAAFTEGLTYERLEPPADEEPSNGDLHHGEVPFRQRVEFWIASTGAPPPLAPTDDPCRIPF